MKQFTNLYPVSKTLRFELQPVGKTKENIEKIRDLEVDYISSGALTHSAPILDVSLKNMRRI